MSVKRNAILECRVCNEHKPCIAGICGCIGTMKYICLQCIFTMRKTRCGVCGEDYGLKETDVDQKDLPAPFQPTKWEVFVAKAKSLSDRYHLDLWGFFLFSAVAVAGESVCIAKWFSNANSTHEELVAYGNFTNLHRMFVDVEWYFKWKRFIINPWFQRHPKATAMLLYCYRKTQYTLIITLAVAALCNGYLNVVSQYDLVFAWHFIVGMWFLF